MVTTLAGEVAAISGGLGDIGQAITVELARRGADIAVCDVRDDVEADSLLEQVAALGRRARYDRADVSDAAAVDDWLGAVEQDLGLPTLIIPNAAVVNLVTFEQLTPAQWDDELAINLNGMFHVAQLATQRLRAADRPGRVVFIGSWAGHIVHPHIPTYCVAKAAVRMLCQCLAAELSPHGILVNEVAPGWVDGGLTGKLLAQNPETRPDMVQAAPVRRLITPAEVAEQVAHLCEPANRQMTGSTLLMDGGLSLFGSGGQKP